MNKPEKIFKLKTALEDNKEIIADATLVLHEGQYYLLEESELVETYWADFARRRTHGKQKAVNITPDGSLRGIPFGHPVVARNYVLGTYLKHIAWVDESNGKVLV